MATGEVRVQEGTAWIAFAPRGAAGGAVTRGARASFAQAWPGVELRYTAAGDAVREEMVVRDRSSVRDFAFDLRIPAGYVPVQEASSAVVVRDAKGVQRFRLSPSTMIDAAGTRTLTTSSLVRDRQGWQLRIVPDREWLNQPERRWPVTVDPTVELAPALSCTISYYEAGEGGTGCGEPGAPLSVGEACQDLCAFQRALVRFDVAEALPAGAVVEYAALDPQVSTGDPGDLYYEPLTKAWDEDVTWDSADGTTAWSTHAGWPDRGGLGDLGDGSNFTGLVRGWADGTIANHGLLFWAPLEHVYELDEFSPELSIQYAETDDPEGTVQQAAVASYLEDEPAISAAEALRRLKVQDRFARILKDVRDAIDPADFAGTWVDDQDGGTIKIGIETNDPSPPPAKVDDAQDILVDHHLEDDVDFEAVASSLQDLAAARDDLVDDLKTLIGAGKVQLSRDVSINSLVVETASSLTPTESAQVSAAIGAVSVDVVTHASTDADLLGDPDADEGPCGKVTGVPQDTGPEAWITCDTPFRAGTGIFSDPECFGEDDCASNRCTSGFFATPKADSNPANDEDLYMLTAGHCVHHGERSGHPPVTTPWHTYRAGSTWEDPDDKLLIGSRHSSVVSDEDIGAINVLPYSALYSADPIDYVYVTASSNTTHDETYKIGGVGIVDTTKDSRICHTSGRPFANGDFTVCAKVTDDDTHTGEKYYGYTDSLFRIDSCRPRAGGSGGPAYKNHIAYGIYVISAHTSSEHPCRRWFTHAVAAEELLHVNIVRSQ